MGLGNKIFGLIFVFILLAGFGASSLAQSEDIDMRIKRQTRRIDKGLQEGFLQPKQAAKLKANLKAISQEANSVREQNEGALKPAELTKLNNDLNQNLNNIETQSGAGKKMGESSNALGPKWAQGQDGAQDPKKLRREMKVQERRQLKQYDQAMQQKQEVQQQQYEKEMLKQLGQQRPEILKNKQNLEKVRQDTGAN